MVEKSVFYYNTMYFNEIEEISNSETLNDPDNFEDSENKTNCNLWLAEGFQIFSGIDLDVKNINDIKTLLEEFDVYEKSLYDEIEMRCQRENDNKIQKQKKKFLIRFIDFCLRENFDNIDEKMRNSIMEKLNEVNDSYNDINNLNEKDLSDEVYMKKIEKAFDTSSVPYFLLRRGFKLRKGLKEKLLEIKKLINETETTKSKSKKEIIFFKLNNNDGVFFLLFINFLKYKKETKMIKDNIKLLCEYFYLDSSYYENNIDELFDENNDYELFFLSLDEIINSKNKINVMLNSYYDLIKNIELFENPKEIYLDFLLFLKDITPKNYEILIKILTIKIDDFFSDDNNDNNENDDKKTEKETEYDFKNNENDKFYAKSYNYQSIKDIFNNIIDKNIKQDFEDILKQEKAFEEGCNSELFDIISLIRKKLSFKDNSNTKTIEDRLQLVVNKKKKVKNDSIITIVISGLYSSFSDGEYDWEYLIENYEKIYNNNPVYYYNWPSSYLNPLDLLFHRKDFRETKNKARYCGQILALIIASNAFFPNCKINLIAFSLGNHVMKHCLKILDNYNKLHLINDIIFIAGATSLCEKWEKRFNKVSGKIFNCYSGHDLALYYSYTITLKKPIGLYELKWKNVEKYKFYNIYFSCFHTCYRYRFQKLIKNISQYYD